MPQPLSSETMILRVWALVAVTGLVLLGFTWPLWFKLDPVFPQVPLVSWCVSAPECCDVLATGLMVASLVAGILFITKPKLRRVAGLLFVASFAAAALLNQHRLQPWAWEFALIFLVLSLMPADRAVWALRLLVASIYLHSGLSKCDLSFLISHGESFVSVLTNWLGWKFSEAPIVLRRMLVALLPAGEIAVAVGLCVSKTRQFAVGFSLLMHGLLIVILGPWGLGHQPGVLIWNAYFIAQNLILFRPIEKSSPPLVLGNLQQFGKIFGWAVVGLAILLPFLEPIGYWDHWPAWAVYASRPERTRVYVAEHRLPELPAGLQPFIEERETTPEAVERWLMGEPPLRQIRIDRWSLAAVNAPIYPQDRFHIGVALALAEHFDLREDITVEIDSAADRWTGERTTQTVSGQRAVWEVCRRFALNAVPRQ